MTIHTFLQKLGAHFFFAPVIIQNLLCRKKILLPLYSEKNKTHKYKAPNKDKLIIYMVLKETTFSGGLSDRLRGICSIYEECKRQNIKFRIFFKTPNLSDYLQPNIYEWNITEDEIDYNTKRSYPCSIMTYHNVKNKFASWAQKCILKRFMSKRFSQIHVYSNMVSGDKHYSQLFNELFKPTSILQEQIDYHLQKLGGKQKYISVVFRFQSLIGDFVESGCTLPEAERDKYLNRCKATVIEIHRLHPDRQILVTSDSHTFLNTLTDLDYVYLLPGKVVHISHVFNADKSTYLKSFLDYYMLSYSSHIWLVRDKLMYHSGFPYRASLLNGAKYDEIEML